MTQKPIIEVKELSKTYQNGQGSLTVLQEINLSINSGDSVAVMGPSGSGKSTLLHILGCLDAPSTGKYYFHQQDISTLPDDDLSRLRASSIGFVFQAFNLIPQLSVYENVSLPFLYQQKKNLEVKEKVLEAIDHVGLSHRKDHRPNQLSGGEMQRVAVARALAIDPLLILADEPTGNLDSKTAQTIMTLFQSLQHKGVTLLLITHDVHIGSYCQRQIHMRDGKIVRDCPTIP